MNMIKYTKKTFVDFFSNSRVEFADFEFVNCKFVNSAICSRDCSNRCTIRNVRILNCTQDRCLLEAPILQNVIVDGLNTKGQMPEVLGAVFDRVTLRGKIDRLWIKPSVVDPGKQADFDKANAEIYRKVDWAIDISMIDSKELYVSGVPVRLIRRDPETQAIVTYEKAAQGRWKNLRFHHGLFEVILDNLVEFKYPGAVLIADKRSLNFKKLVADLEMLHKEGIVEPD
jgi:hypothetical protein